MWQIPFCLVNSLNSALVKHVPLSVTRTSGNPWTEKMEVKCSISGSRGCRGNDFAH